MKNDRKFWEKYRKIGKRFADFGEAIAILPVQNRLCGEPAPILANCGQLLANDSPKRRYFSHFFGGKTFTIL
jgi:hypothetical protein